MNYLKELLLVILLDLIMILGISLGVYCTTDLSSRESVAVAVVANIIISILATIAGWWYRRRKQRRALSRRQSPVQSFKERP